MNDSDSLQGIASIISRRAIHDSECEFVNIQVCSSLLEKYVGPVLVYTPIMKSSQYVYTQVSNFSNPVRNRHSRVKEDSFLFQRRFRESQG